MYAISLNKENILDFETYLQILKLSKLKFKKLNFNSLKINNVSGLIKCDEEFIDKDIAKKFYLKRFGKELYLNKEIKKLKKFKNQLQIFGENLIMSINCSWQQFNPVPKWNLSYELCLSLII